MYIAIDKCFDTFYTEQPTGKALLDFGCQFYLQIISLPTYLSEQKTNVCSTGTIFRMHTDSEINQNY